MVQWGKRTPEIAYLLNPSFCAAILYATLGGYQKKSGLGMDFTLTYLILPIILYKRTRDRIDSRTNMVVWLQRNPDALIGFPERARSLVVFTNEAIEFLLHQQSISIDGRKVTIKKSISNQKKNRFCGIDPEIADCIQKAAHLGRWFFNIRSDESIYAAWGVRP